MFLSGNIMFLEALLRYNLHTQFTILKCIIECFFILQYSQAFESPTKLIL